MNIPTNPTIKPYKYMNMKFEPTNRIALLAIWGREKTGIEDDFQNKTLVFNVFNGEFIGTLEIFLDHESATGWRFIECRGTNEKQIVRQKYLPLPSGYKINTDELIMVVEAVSKLVMRTHTINMNSGNWEKGNFVVYYNNTDTLADEFPNLKYDVGQKESARQRLKFC